jgi:hypothetical protein
VIRCGRAARRAGAGRARGAEGRAARAQARAAGRGRRGAAEQGAAAERAARSWRRGAAPRQRRPAQRAARAPAAPPNSLSGNCSLFFFSLVVGLNCVRLALRCGSEDDTPSLLATCRSPNGSTRDSESDTLPWKKRFATLSCL